MEDYIILRVSPEVRKILERGKMISLVHSEDGEKLLIGEMCIPLHTENVLSRNELWKTFNGSTFVKIGDVIRILDSEEVKSTDDRNLVSLKRANTLKTQMFDDTAETDVLLLSGNSAESVRDIKFEEEIVE